MNAAPTPTAPPAPVWGVDARLRRRRITHRVATGLCLLLCVVAIYPLLSLLWVLVERGLSSISWEFLTSEPSVDFVPGRGVVYGGGIAHAIQGSLMVVGIGTMLGAPFGLMLGTFLAESPRQRIAGVVRTIVDSMSGLPSIVSGLFAYAFVVHQLGMGFSAWAGGVALAALMLPTVARTTEEALRTVPQSYRDAAFALGAPRWRTVLFVVFPAAWGPVLTGLLLGVARIAGETAPLVLKMIYGPFTNTDPSKSVATLPVLIYNYGKASSPEQNAQGWGAALVLITLVLLLNLVVRGLSRLRMRRMGKA